MKRVYSAEDGLMVDYIRRVLTAEGIECIIKNQTLSGAMGELPPSECAPEVWILEDDNHEKSQAIIDALSQAPPKTLTAWRCRCGETIDAQFSDCWKCGSARHLA